MPHSQSVQSRRFAPVTSPKIKLEKLQVQKIKKILVIEDDEDIKYPLMVRLEHLGYQVLSAADGREGLFDIVTMRPDVIVLDLFLPSLSGEEVCKSVRDHEDPAISKMPIIMVTAKGSQADRIVGKVIGANAYLTKPFEFEDLLKEIQKYAPSPRRG